MTKIYLYHKLSIAIDTEQVEGLFISPYYLKWRGYDKSRSKSALCTVA